jgi:hypothetical protein
MDNPTCNGFYRNWEMVVTTPSSLESSGAAGTGDPLPHPLLTRSHRHRYRRQHYWLLVHPQGREAAQVCFPNLNNTALSHLLTRRSATPSSLLPPPC